MRGDMGSACDGCDEDDFFPILVFGPGGVDAGAGCCGCCAPLNATPPRLC